jgi:hypothetical protein
MSQEDQIRLAVFQWLEEQTRFDDVLPWSTLLHGFSYQGHRISLVGQQGIWKPKVFKSIPISIRTSHQSPYHDGFTADGLLCYRYRGTDPRHHENAGLREALLKQAPLVYFHALLPGKYLAAWPVYVIGEDQASLSFIMALDDKRYLEPGQADVVLGHARQICLDVVTVFCLLHIHAETTKTAKAGETLPDRLRPVEEVLPGLGPEEFSTTPSAKRHQAIHAHYLLGFDLLNFNLQPYFPTNIRKGQSQRRSNISPQG